MKRLSVQYSFLIAAFALASLPAGLLAQSENESIEALRAGSEANETQSGEREVPGRVAILQPGTVEPAGQVPLKPWTMPRTLTGTPLAKSWISPPLAKSWISAGPGSLPLAVAIQPDATQKYGTNPGILQFYFGHRR